MSSTPEISAERVAARAAELAIEQKARLDNWLKTRDKRQEFTFYTQAIEIETTIQINYLLREYAMLKGYVRQGQRLRVTRSPNRRRENNGR